MESKWIKFDAKNSNFGKTGSENLNICTKPRSILKNTFWIINLLSLHSMLRNESILIQKSKFLEHWFLKLCVLNEHEITGDEENKQLLPV